jgi:hypothetical protein
MAKFRPEDLPTGRESRESHIEFIRINWPIAAAFAWQQYRQQGRGCIVIDVAQAKDPPPGESHLFGETLGAYIPYKIVRVTGDADVKRMVKKYNPRLEVVFVFLREDGGVSSYRLYIHNQPSPPEAYEELKREM